MIIWNYRFFSSVLTNGHCVCGQQERKFEDGIRCLPGKSNQITDKNKVLIASGDNRKQQNKDLAKYETVRKVGMINEIEHIVTNYIENYNQKKHGGYKYDIAVLKSSKEIYKEGDTTRSIICRRVPGV